MENKLSENELKILFNEVYTAQDMCKFAEYAITRMTQWVYNNGLTTELIYNSEEILKQFIEEQNEKTYRK